MTLGLWLPDDVPLEGADVGAGGTALLHGCRQWEAFDWESVLSTGEYPEDFETCMYDDDGSLHVESYSPGASLEASGGGEAEVISDRVEPEIAPYTVALQVPECPSFSTVLADFAITAYTWQMSGPE